MKRSRLNKKSKPVRKEGRLVSLEWESSDGKVYSDAHLLRDPTLVKILKSGGKIRKMSG